MTVLYYKTERTEKRLLKDYFDDDDAVFSVYDTAEGTIPEPVSASLLELEPKMEKPADAVKESFAAVTVSTNDNCSFRNDCREQTSTQNQAINSLPLAMAYVPMQQFRCLYSPEEALNAGTLFKELDMPFSGGNQGRGQR